MTRSQFQRALFVMLGALAWLFVAILFVLITKDDWHLFGWIELIATVVFFLTIPIMCWTSYQFGRYDERHRQRARITSLMDTYQTEPHGIRYSQKHRDYI